MQNDDLFRCCLSDVRPICSSKSQGKNWSAKARLPQYLRLQKRILLAVWSQYSTTQYNSAPPEVAEFRLPSVEDVCILYPRIVKYKVQTQSPSSFIVLRRLSLLSSLCSSTFRGAAIQRVHHRPVCSLALSMESLVTSGPLSPFSMACSPLNTTYLPL